jgi:hypothetical protein
VDPLCCARLTLVVKSHAEQQLGSCRTLSTNVSINQNGARPNSQPLQHQRSASITSQSSATQAVAQPPVSAPPQSAPQPPQQQQPQPQPQQQQQRTTPPPAPPVHATPPLPPQQSKHTNGASVSPEQLASMIRQAGDDGADVQVRCNDMSASILCAARHMLLNLPAALGTKLCTTAALNRFPAKRMV